MDRDLKFGWWMHWVFLVFNAICAGVNLYFRNWLLGATFAAWVINHAISLYSVASQQRTRNEVRLTNAALAGLYMVSENDPLSQ